MRKYIILFFLISPIFVSAQVLSINEIMAANTSTIKDESGNYSDWIEIKNNSDDDYDLAAHYISDNKKKITKFQFTADSGKVVVPANGYLLIRASGNVDDGNLHTSFSLSSNGEDAVLTLPDGETVLDSISFPPLKPDMSYGRNSKGIWVYFNPATPGKANLDENSYSGFLSPPSFSQKGGFFDSDFQLFLYHDDPEVKIVYTLDGSEPTLDNLGGTSYYYKTQYAEYPGQSTGELLERTYTSNLYTDPILIYDRTQSPNEISGINVTNQTNPAYLPQYNVSKAFIVRARVEKEGFLSSEVEANTYIYNATGGNPYTFPVVSLQTSENNLFDYMEGIYTPGKDYDDAREAEPYADLSHCTPGNYKRKGKSTQKTASFEVFDLFGRSMSQAIELRLNGGCTTAYPYKSFRIYGNNVFDGFNFFEEYPDARQHRILLRNSGNDQFMTLFKDEFVQEWVKHLNFASQKHQPAILYLNGEYWGIHNIRERIDKYFLNELYGVDPDNVDLIKLSFDGNEASEGDFEHYDQTFDYIIYNDMSSDEALEYVSTMLDLDSFIDFYIAHSFTGNIDWPQNNVRLWRARNEYKPEEGFLDGRWRYIFYDADRALGEVVPAINNDYMNNGLFSRENSQVLSKLLENRTFKNKFVNRLADLMNTTFSTEYGLELFNEYKNLYSPEVEKHIKRWKSHHDMSAWEYQTNIVELYIQQRTEMMYNMHMRYAEKFGLYNVYEIKVVNQDFDKGYAQVNSIVIDDKITRGLKMSGDTWTGRYFGSIPVIMKGIAKPGFAFSHWEYNGNRINDQELVVDAYSNVEIKPFFKFVGFPDNYPQAHIMNAGNFVFNYWDSESDIATYPPHTAFINKTSQKGEGPELLPLSFIWGKYNLNEGTRVNGLYENGVSFVNAHDASEGYTPNQLGGFIVALNTEEINNVLIKFSVETLQRTNGENGFRLLYRVGNREPFRSLGIEYKGGELGHMATFDGIRLPKRAIGKEYVQLYWELIGGDNVSESDELAIKEVLIIPDSTEFIELAPYDHLIKIWEDF